MSTVAEQRLMKDLKHLQDDSPPGVSSAPREDNLMVWDAVILGPEATPWEGGTFKLMLEFGSEYPNKPPKVKFISQMFHPNIYDSGIICLDILDREWSPIYDVASILTSIQSLLSDPNPGSPANGEAALLFSNDKRAYNRRVREVTEQSWIGN